MNHSEKSFIYAGLRGMISPYFQKVIPKRDIRHITQHDINLLNITPWINYTLVIGLCKEKTPLNPNKFSC